VYAGSLSTEIRINGTQNDARMIVPGGVQASEIHPIIRQENSR